MTEEKMTVVMLTPGEESKITEIGTRLEDFQKAVGGGCIEAVYPFRDDVCLICNDEGKYNGMKPNRTLYGERKQVLDIVFGPCFICAFDNENFKGLSPDMAEKYERLFKVPEKLMLLGGKPSMVPCPAEKGMER